MKQALFLLAILCTGGCAVLPAPLPIDRVDPLIGTRGGGNVYPGASAPFGMVQLSPDNGRSGWERIAGYDYGDSTIAGFSHTHLSGTGAGDGYDIALMPYLAPARRGRGELGIHSVFSHADETAQAGYYRVRLQSYGIEAELTATERCGMHRYTFPAGSAPIIQFDLTKAMNWDRTREAHIEVVDAHTLRGYRLSQGWAADQRVYFEARFSEPFTECRIDSAAHPAGGRVHLHFAPRGNHSTPIVVRVGISGVDPEGAMRNLSGEIPSFHFDSVRQTTQEAWNKALDVVHIEGGTPAQQTVFYTALYRSMLAPTLFSDVDGRYRGGDGSLHTARGWRNYTTFSLWDTYRAAHTLYALICPDRTVEMARSMLEFHRQTGALPVWPLWGNETDMMIGNHAVPVLAEAYLKGLLPAEWGEEVLAACQTSVDRTNYRGMDHYRQRGYVAADREGESLSKTLEYAYDDHAVALLARRLGHDSLARAYAARAQNYRNLFDSVSGFFRPRLADGSWRDPFDPKAYTADITESNGWHYLWSAPHDPQGLVALLGGPEAFERRLDQFFALDPAAGDSLPIFSTGMIGQYAHGNEPSHHVAYLYNYVGRPEKSARRIHQILTTLYTDTPEGLCGNEDCGQMSAWYVLSSLGLYPVDPAGGEFALGVPLFPKATLRLPGGAALTVAAPRAGTGRWRVKTIRWRGKPLDQPFLHWDDLRQGGELRFEIE